MTTWRYVHTSIVPCIDTCLAQLRTRFKLHRARGQFLGSLLPSMCVSKSFDDPRETVEMYYSFLDCSLEEVEAQFRCSQMGSHDGLRVRNLMLKGYTPPGLMPHSNMNAGLDAGAVQLGALAVAVAGPDFVGNFDTSTMYIVSSTFCTYAFVSVSSS